MMRSPNFSPYQHSARNAGTPARNAKGAADFLQAHDKMAALLPMVNRMAALQKDCAATLPAMFEACAVLQYEDNQLVLSTPNAALASKLKQQLPKLQEGLLKRGWQVNAIRLKVQVSNLFATAQHSKTISLPTQALSALASLDQELENSPRNAALKTAISAMLQRHRTAK